MKEEERGEGKVALWSQEIVTISPNASFPGCENFKKIEERERDGRGTEDASFVTRPQRQ